jgi:hypothetical protein
MRSKVRALKYLLVGSGAIGQGYLKAAVPCGNHSFDVSFNVDCLAFADLHSKFFHVRDNSAHFKSARWTNPQQSLNLTESSPFSPKLRCSLSNLLKRS